MSISKQHKSEYASWSGMIQRCENPNVAQYADYGGRGITVCSRWRYAFAAFLQDMGPKPFKGATIERKDNNGNYELANCMWADKITQCNNKRNNRVIEHDGQSHTLQEWSRITGIDRNTIATRLNYGWDVATALGLHSSRASACFVRTARITHCPKGHEYTEANSRWDKNKTGGYERTCKKCESIQNKAYRMKNAQRLKDYKKARRILEKFAALGTPITIIELPD